MSIVSKYKKNVYVLFCRLLVGMPHQISLASAYRRKFLPWTSTGHPQSGSKKGQRQRKTAPGRLCLHHRCQAKVSPKAEREIVCHRTLELTRANWEVSFSFDMLQAFVRTIQDHTSISTVEPLLRLLALVLS